MWGLGLGSIFLLAVSASLSCCNSLGSPQGLDGNETSGKMVRSSRDSISFQIGNLTASSTNPSTETSFRKEYKAVGDHKTVRADQ